MTKWKRRQFTPEFKADAVKLVRAGGRCIGETVRDLDLGEAALRLALIPDLFSHRVWEMPCAATTTLSSPARQKSGPEARAPRKPRLACRSPSRTAPTNPLPSEPPLLPLFASSRLRVSLFHLLSDLQPFGHSPVALTRLGQPCPRARHNGTHGDLTTAPRWPDSASWG